jgi:hypothetical protein
MNSTQRAHILIPSDLLREIDAIVGPRGRTAFLLETAREEVRRRKLLRLLESNEAAWREGDHPELGGGSAAWVRKLRTGGETRTEMKRRSTTRTAKIRLKKRKRK